MHACSSSIGQGYNCADRCCKAVLVCTISHSSGCPRIRSYSHRAVLQPDLNTIDNPRACITVLTLSDMLHSLHWEMTSWLSVSAIGLPIHGCPHCCEHIMWLWEGCGHASFIRLLGYCARYPCGYVSDIPQARKDLSLSAVLCKSKTHLQTFRQSPVHSPP